MTTLMHISIASEHAIFEQASKTNYTKHAHELQLSTSMWRKMFMIIQASKFIRAGWCHQDVQNR